MAEARSIAQDAGQQVIVSGLQGHALRALVGLGVLRRVPEENRFPTRMEAIRAAVGQMAAAKPGPAPH